MFVGEESAGREEVSGNSLDDLTEASGNALEPDGELRKVPLVARSSDQFPEQHSSRELPSQELAEDAESDHTSNFSFCSDESQEQHVFQGRNNPVTMSPKKQMIRFQTSNITSQSFA